MFTLSVTSQSFPWRRISFINGKLSICKSVCWKVTNFSESIPSMSCRSILFVFYVFLFFLSSNLSTILIRLRKMKHKSYHMNVHCKNCLRFFSHSNVTPRNRRKKNQICCVFVLTVHFTLFSCNFEMISMLHKQIYTFFLAFTQYFYFFVNRVMYLW